MHFLFVRFLDFVSSCPRLPPGGKVVFAINMFLWWLRCLWVRASARARLHACSCMCNRFWETWSSVVIYFNDPEYNSSRLTTLTNFWTWRYSCNVRSLWQACCWQASRQGVDLVRLGIVIVRVIYLHYNTYTICNICIPLRICWAQRHVFLPFQVHV